MLAAPHGAFYLVAHQREEYHATALKHHLGRSDLKIISTGSRWVDAFQGRRNSVLVIDHWAGVHPHDYQLLCAYGVEVRYYGD